MTSEVGHGSTFWFNLPTSVLVDHALSSANSTPRDPPVINGFTTSGALPEGREGEIDEDEKDEDEKDLPPLMESHGVRFQVVLKLLRNGSPFLKIPWSKAIEHLHNSGHVLLGSS